jgi:predicted transcriptional regulator
MDIQAEKLELINWLSNLKDVEVLNRFIALRKQQETDWWDLISDEEKREIEEGLQQIERGEVVPHEEVMAKYNQWRTK